MPTPIRRVVTTHDVAGQSVIKSDDRLTVSTIPTGDADMVVVWTTGAVPADNQGDVGGDKRPAGVTLGGGSVIRIVDLLPLAVSPMHRSFSIDYGIILSGKLELMLDGGETTLLGPGDIVVQRGTNHAWRNPSAEQTCRIVFVLIEAKPVVVDGATLGETDLHGVN